MLVLNVNSNAVLQYTKQLEALRKSALPTAVRNTLNNAALDVKTKTMPKVAKETFTQRKPNFFKANSKVEFAKGGNIATLKATVGFVPKDAAVQELKQQEDGGRIGGRSFIANEAARVGGSWDKQVKAPNRTAVLANKKIIKAATGGKLSRKQKFIRAAFVAKKLHGNSAMVLGNRWGDGSQTLSRIHSVSANKKGVLRMKRTAIYTYRKGRSVQVAGTNFMKRASNESGLKLDDMFHKNATNVLKKLMKQK